MDYWFQPPDQLHIAPSEVKAKASGNVAELESEIGILKISFANIEFKQK